MAIAPTTPPAPSDALRKPNIAAPPPSSSSTNSASSSTYDEPRTNGITTTVVSRSRCASARRYAIACRRSAVIERESSRSIEPNEAATPNSSITAAARCAPDVAK